MSANHYYTLPSGQTVPYAEHGNHTIYDGSSNEPVLISSLNVPNGRNSGQDITTAGDSSVEDYGYGNLMNMPHRTPVPETIPIEFEIQGIYEDLDRRRKQNAQDKDLKPHVKSRRRAQNRASQRAFRDRKERHVKQVEERLKELEGKYSDLTESYDALQKEYITIKAELDKLMSNETRGESLSLSPSGGESYLSDATPAESPFSILNGGGLDSLDVFEDSVFYFDHDNEERTSSRCENEE